MAPRRPPCQDVTHRFRAGTLVCLTCKAARQRRHRAANNGAAIVPAGLSVMQAAAHRAWATRRQRYGDVGVPAATRAQFAAALTGQRIAARPRNECRKGHPLVGENVLLNDGRVRCRICRRASQRRQTRPLWVTVHGGRISLEAHDATVQRELGRLKAALVAAHPDKGGTSSRFIAAKRAYDTCVARERAWYAAYGIAPPRLVKAA